MKLYYAETMNSWKTCAAARHLGLAIDFHRLDLRKGDQRTPAFLAVNPNGKAPALVDGDRAIWESNAIMCHLAARAGSNLWPADASGQVEVVRWFLWSSEHFSRYAGQLYFEHVIRPGFGFGDPDEKAVAEATGYVRKYAAVLDRHLSGRRHLLGDDLTLADFAVATTLPYAAEAKIPLADFPAVAAWHDRLMALPAWRDPFATGGDTTM